jgi:pyridine nucleotide-disulfide oxidoreductase family protein
MADAPHRLVLVGGGHTHVQVMRALGQRPEPGLAVTLVTDRALTPYSGMLPGHVAGFYDRDAMHIDLVRLAGVCRIDLVAASATGIDRAAKVLTLAGGRVLPYDTLSLNIGITPDLSEIAGAETHGLAVKPIAGFLDKLDALMAAAARPDGPRRIALVGGGAAGVELAFALRARLAAVDVAGRPFWVGIITGSGVVPSSNPGVRARVMAAFARHRIAVVTGFRVMEIDAEGVRATDGRFIAADAVLVSTAARGASWLAGTGLPLSADGSILTTPGFASIADPAVHAVGDCGSIEGAPRAKAGVFAVRQGVPLADNLRRHTRGEAPLPHHPQQDYLTILMTGDGSAIAGRGGWLAVEGRWVWRWKDWIDQRFMARFAEFRA